MSDSKMLCACHQISTCTANNVLLPEASLPRCLRIEVVVHKTRKEDSIIRGHVKSRGHEIQEDHVSDLHMQKEVEEVRARPLSRYSGHKAISAKKPMLM